MDKIQLLSAFLFTIGLLIVITRRNTIVLLMGVELLLNAANLSMVKQHLPRKWGG